MSVLRVVAVALLLAVAALHAAADSDQDFVVVGHEAIQHELADNPSLDFPVLLEEGAEQVQLNALEEEGEFMQPMLLESDATTFDAAASSLDALLNEHLNDEALAIESPLLAQERSYIEADQALLAQMELLAHRMGAPVLSALTAQKAAVDVSNIESKLTAVDATAATKAAADKVHNLHFLSGDASIPQAFALLESAPASAKLQDQVDEDSMLESQLAMIEMSQSIGAHEDDAAAVDKKKHDYAIMEAKFQQQQAAPGAPVLDGAAISSLKNLKGLDVYVVNTPFSDNDHEIHPVKPPNPQSALNREKAKLAAMRMKNLIHNVPQPQAKVKPKTPINTLSAYEPALSPVSAVLKVTEDYAVGTAEPMVGGAGAMQLKGTVSKKNMPRFQRLRSRISNAGAGAAAAGASNLPGNGALPNYPAPPQSLTVSGPVVVGPGSSFDNRDGPPQLLDDLLPLKAVLVEELEPLHP